MYYPALQSPYRVLAQTTTAMSARKRKKLVLPSAPPPRNPVVRALAQRKAAGAGTHVRSVASQRSQDKVAVRKMVDD